MKLRFFVIFLLGVGGGAAIADTSVDLAANADLAALRGADKAIDVRLNALAAEKIAAFHQNIQQCSAPIQGVDWIEYRSCVIQSMPSGSASIAEAFDNWSAGLHRFAQQLDKRERLLDQKTELLDEFKTVLQALKNTETELRQLPLADEKRYNLRLDSVNTEAQDAVTPVLDLTQPSEQDGSSDATTVLENPNANTDDKKDND